ncbi:MAG: insulinase family protein [Acidobacteriota bacterium]|jgi:predicted Zn-dependent peptidase
MVGGPVIVVEPLPHATTAAVGAFVRSGSAHEPAHLAGITHLIEHLLLRRTARRATAEIAELIDALGGGVDVYTTRESCAITAHVPAVRFSEALDLIVEALFAPRFTAADVRLERGIVAAEFDLVQDSPAESAAERALLAAWDGHPLARPVLGERGIVERLGVESLRTYHRQRFTTSRLLVVAAGPLSEAAIARRLPAPSPSSPEPALAPPVWHPGVMVEEREGLEQVYVNLVLPGLPAGHPDGLVLAVLHQLLGAGNASRLFRELRDRRGLVYEVESAVDATSLAGVLEVVFSAPVRQVAAAWAAVLKVLEEVGEGRIADREVALARESIASAIVLGTEGPDALMEAHAAEMLARGRRFDAAQLRRELDAVTPERVRELARRLVRLELLAGAVCGPPRGLLLPAAVTRRVA